MKATVRISVWVMLGSLLVSLVCACSMKPGNGCQSGASTPELAVTELLRAAQAKDLQRACRVTNAMPDDYLAVNLSEIAGFLDAIGGVERVIVREDKTQQMGSAFYVEVLVPDSTASIGFNVVRSGGRYLVYPPEQPDGNATDLPTADPNPPPSDLASSNGGMTS